MKGFYPIVTRILRSHLFEYLRSAKGDHEIWSDGRVKVTVPYNLIKKNTANAILKKAGIDERV
jgi:hypothetical protein